MSSAREKSAGFFRATRTSACLPGRRQRLRNACTALTRAERAPAYTGPACTPAGQQETLMNDNRIEGTEHQVKGTVKEGIGKLTGNTSKEVAGNLEKNAGKVQKNVGQAQDEIEDLDD
jgi:uncharacterized protein YjbJ (UPF0337 family)